MSPAPRPFRTTTRPVAVAFGILALALSPAAHAVGLLVYDRETPHPLHPSAFAGIEVSSAEVIVAQDGDATDLVVQARVGGEIETFGWIIPVPAAASVQPGITDEFEQLRASTGAQLETTTVIDGTCKEPPTSDTGWLPDAYTPPGDAPVLLPDGHTSHATRTALTRVAAAPSGTSLETTTVPADTLDALHTWLADHDFDLPPGADEALAAYLGPDAAFVVVRATKTAQYETLPPVHIRYQSAPAPLPITLTALDRQRAWWMKVVVMGQTRAVPRDAALVAPNLLPLRWGLTDSGFVGTMADIAYANEGTISFATESAGPTPDMGLWSQAWQDDVDTLARASHAFDWLTAFQSTAFASTSDAASVLEALLPVAEIAPGSTTLYTHPEDHEDALRAYPFDPVPAAALVDRLLVQPRKAAHQRSVRHATTTRMHTHLWPTRFDTDPSFVSSHTAPAVPRLRRSTRTTWCDPSILHEEAEHVWEVDGFEVPWPSLVWQRDTGTSYNDLVEMLAEPALRTMWTRDAQGVLTVTANHDDAIRAAITAFTQVITAPISEPSPTPAPNGDPLDNTPTSSGGCQTAPQQPIAWFVLLGLLGLRRRQPGA